MRKKGATVQTIIISIIILVTSAAIIFFFLKAFPYKETIDKEACHQSVILRNNALLKGEFGLEIPLNCKTQRIKISSTNEESIKREIADAMYDCWWMLGEGKMQRIQLRVTVTDVHSDSSDFHPSPDQNHLIVSCLCQCFKAWTIPSHSGSAAKHLSLPQSM